MKKIIKAVASGLGQEKHGLRKWVTCYAAKYFVDGSRANGVPVQHDLMFSVEYPATV